MKILVSLFTLALIAIHPSHAASEDFKTPLEVVNQRMAAHNAHDIEAFLANYADDAQVYTYPDKQLGKPGKEHLRKIFEPLFDNKSVQTVVHSQLQNGNYVINHETVTRNGKKFVYLSIYEVVEGSIKSIRFIHEK